MTKTERRMGCIPDDLMCELEEFTCKMYTKLPVGKTDDLGYAILRKKCDNEENTIHRTM